MVPSKDELHRLVDQLPEDEVPAARRYLEFLRERGEDPLRQALDRAPADDEAETPEEAAAVAQAREDEQAGRVVSHDEVRREFER